jgi:hypothetical protein
LAFGDGACDLSKSFRIFEGNTKPIKQRNEEQSIEIMSTKQHFTNLFVSKLQNAIKFEDVEHEKFTMLAQYSSTKK